MTSYKTVILGEFLEPSVHDLMGRAIALLIETTAEEFDRSLPGVLIHGNWIPMQQFMHLSVRTYRELTERGKRALGSLGVPGIRLDHRSNHTEMLSELEHMRRAVWWPDVEQAWNLPPIKEDMIITSSL